MPQTKLHNFLDETGGIPVATFLLDLRERNEHRAVEQLMEKLKLLAENGYALRPPAAKLLRTGLYELRARVGKKHFRIAYCFAQGVAVLLHGWRAHLSPADDEREITRALARRDAFLADPDRHTAGRLAQELTVPQPGCLCA